LRSILNTCLKWLDAGRAVLYVVSGDRDRRVAERQVPQIGLAQGLGFGTCDLAAVRKGRPQDGGGPGY
jgi:hypothetical protein